MQAHDETASYRDSNQKTAQLALWTLAWVATLAVARLGPEFLWDAQQATASWIALTVNVLVGIAWIIAMARYLRAIDELWRKINQDALAVTLGVGWVVGFAYFVADAAGLVAHDLNTGYFPALLGVVYLIVVIIGWFRYR